MINESYIKSQSRLYTKAWAHCSILEEVGNFFSNREGVLLEDTYVKSNIDNFLHMIFSESRSHEEHVELVDCCNQCFFESEIYKDQLVAIEKNTLDNWKIKLTLKTSKKLILPFEERKPSMPEVKEEKAEQVLESLAVKHGHNALGRASSHVSSSPMKKLKTGRDEGVEQHSEFVLSEYYQARQEAKKKYSLRVVLCYL